MIVVAMGGYSAEREVSLESGQAVYEALGRLGLPAVLFDYSGDNFSELLALHPTLVFNALHGRGGEDGEIQHLLDHHHIPYTGCNAEVANTTMHKGKTQHILTSHNLPVAKHIVLTQDMLMNFNYQEHNLRPPFAVKPVSEGSSIGISKASVDTLQDALKLAFSYDAEVMVEEWITGQELTVPIIAIDNLPTTLPPIEIITTEEFYNYQAKYQSDSTQYLCPAPVSQNISTELSTLALQAFMVLGCKDWARVDFLLQPEDGQLYILEINTIPGMTSHSLLPQSAKEYGLSFDALVRTIVVSAGYPI